MDGKSGAESLVTKLLKDPALVSAMAKAPKPKPAAETYEESAQA